MTERTCVTCKHFNNNVLLPADLCYCNAATHDFGETVDIITGKKTEKETTYLQTCNMRSFGKCGYYGHLWEKAETPAFRFF